MRHYASSLGCNSTKLVQAIKENHVVSNCPINSAHIASFMSSNSKIEKYNFGHSQSRFIPVCTVATLDRAIKSFEMPDP